MGTMLQEAGLLGGEIPEVYNIIHQDIVANIHKKYKDAGADVITTNTFGANRYKLKNTGYTVEKIITEAVKIAKSYCSDKLIALDIGPIGQLIEPSGTLKFEEAYDIFKEQVIAGTKAGVDLILIETMTDLYETKAAVLAAKENSNLPIFTTMTFEKNGRTMMGTDAKTMVFVLQSLGVDAVGVNCSLGPKEIMPIVDEILKYSTIPVMVQPNAGLPSYDGEKTFYNITPDEFAFYIDIMVKKGVKIVGGCCGTTPEFIKKCKSYIEKVEPKEIDVKRLTVACSSTKSVIFDDGIKIIGERINPTGKKKLKEALKESNIDYVLNEAILQKEAGADILDVNVGLPEINEKELITKIIREIQGIMDIPLQIDSSNYEVLEAAARIYNGKPIINSVNGKEENMKKIFPIVKKYGALVIGLTIDEKGIPETAKERVLIAEKIIKTANNYGIPKEDILIDCLVLTASAQQKEVIETIKAVEIIKKEFGVKTVLGVSNVSFGLPNREILNRTFLAMALTAGLDAPIINPLSYDMLETIYSFKVLSNMDKEAEEYIKYCSSSSYTAIKREYKNTYEKEQKNIDTNLIPVTDNNDFSNILINASKEQITEKTKELLNSYKPLDIINLFLIPALNVVGLKYEKGELFLPQLIKAAEVAKKSFEILKENMKEDSKTTFGKIVLATVKGDIHDIGKNIVKILLENYGFKVIDLGKDVPPEEILKAVKENNIKLVGLSALMTTTVKSMEDTIKYLSDSNLSCKVMVGGAVLTQKYADMIGADFYAKDAMEAVRIAQKVFNVNTDI
ncbi:homocysteine methyltransferase [Caloramator sp. E03]|uniref:homocysteine S-methyltransferase family protein n=1 Tax=Caloramator sp. E03 TaxID=2576307 RepID=UPI001110DF21|nr:homocysteine S-methyltransferase family protein [Caloramator sp. E03]QCX34759.1 homocysteine methyltransferase [Caloramator sp. E03]